jgi:hypothetical protein
MGFRDAREAAQEFKDGGKLEDEERGDLEELVRAAERQLDEHFRAWAKDINQRLTALEEKVFQPARKQNESAARKGK